MNDRSAVIKLCGKEYELLMTTKATKEMAKHFGGLEKIGDNFLHGNNAIEMMDECVWMITLLANQPILLHNMQHKNDQRELLTVENVELMTTLADLNSYSEALVKAMNAGMERNIKSEDEGKNAQVG